MTDESAQQPLLPPPPAHIPPPPPPPYVPPSPGDPAYAVEPAVPVAPPEPAPIDMGGYRRVPLTPLRWRVLVLLLLVASTIALAFGSSWFAYASGIMRGLSPDMRAVVLTLIIFLQYLPPLSFVVLKARRGHVPLKEALSLRRFNVGAGIALALGAMFAARAIGIQYAVFMQTLGVKAPEVPDITRLFPVSPVGVAASVLTAVVLAPLAEEALFRGVVYAGLRERWGQTAGMLVSAGLFALVHFSIFQFVPLFVLGLLLAWLLSATRSLWPSILCHSLFNATAVALLYLFRALGVRG